MRMINSNPEYLSCEQGKSATRPNTFTREEMHPAHGQMHLLSTKVKPSRYLLPAGDIQVGFENDFLAAVE